MVPSAFVMLKDMPLTPNGKLDRRALPAPEGRPEHAGDYTAPRTDLERALSEIWAQVLSVDRVGIHDNFFELGGHSLLGMKLMAKAAHILAFQPPVVSIFQYPTVAQMAQFLEIRLLRNTDEPREWHEEGVI
jgi:hypothetical protein